MDYFDISKVKLKIPELWEKDWELALKETDDEVSIILKAKFRLVNLLKDIEDKSFTFSRGAWLCLWTRLFNIAEGINGALQSNSEMLIDVLERMIFECWLQIYTIVGTEEDTNRVGRLNAYSAWCLYNDLASQNYLLKDSIMDGIWDIEEEKTFLEDSSEKQILHEKLFGPLDIEKLTTDYREADKRKMSHKSQEYKKRDRIEKWLKHKDVQQWVKKIESLGKYTPSFYQLFNKKQKSLFSVLKSFKLNEKDIEFAYIQYKQSSMTLHGSSFHNNFLLNSEMLFPNFTGDSDVVLKRAVGLGSQIYSIAVPMMMLKKEVWPD